MLLMGGAKSRFVQFNGPSKDKFILHLREIESRSDYREECLGVL